MYPAKSMRNSDPMLSSGSSTINQTHTVPVFVPAGAFSAAVAAAGS